jgi:NAD(P) transhydrogenase subunit alpha
MNPLILVAIFVVSSVAGYFVIGNVPSLLHTPLMSGMNALSVITLIGALSATAAAVAVHNTVLGIVAIFLAVLNVVTGFCITHRMLGMFKSKEGQGK